MSKKEIRQKLYTEWIKTLKEYETEVIKWISEQENISFTEEILNKIKDIAKSILTSDNELIKTLNSIILTYLNAIFTTTSLNIELYEQKMLCKLSSDQIKAEMIEMFKDYISSVSIPIKTQWGLE